MKTSRIIISILISIGLLFLLLHSAVNTEDLFEIMKTTDIRLFVGASLFLILANIIVAWRWKLVLSVTGYTLPMRKILGIFFANLPIAKLTPGYTGDFFRVYFLRRDIPVSFHAGIIFFEALVDITSLALLVTIGSIFLNLFLFTFIGISVLCGILLFIVLAEKIPRLFPEKMQSGVKSFVTIFRIFLNKPLAFIPILCISILAAFVISLYVFMLFYAFGSTIPLLAVLALQPIAIFVSLIPISLWGIGIRESIMLLLYAGYASSAIIFSVGFTYSILGAILLPILCIPFSQKAIIEALSQHKQEIS